MGGFWREVGTICQIVVLIRTWCITAGFRRAHFKRWAYRTCGSPFQILSSFGEKQEVFKRHRPKYSQMDPFDMMNVRLSQPTKLVWAQNMHCFRDKRQFDKWHLHLFRAPWRSGLARDLFVHFAGPLLP